MSIELELLNAVIDSRDASALVRHGLMDSNQWITHKEEFEYVKKHVEQFGELPSVTSVIQNTDNFEAVDTAESVDTLCKKLNERNLKNAEKEFIQKLALEFGELDGYDVLTEMEKATESFRKLSQRRGNEGIDWSTSGADRQAEYERRKSREFSRRIPFMFDELTDALGELTAGMYVAIMAFTSKGKTWLGLKQALKSNENGQKVLIESGEMSKEEIMFRLDTLAGGFSNRGLFTGDLDFISEEAYRAWLQQFNGDGCKPPVIIKTQEDWPKGLTVYQIEHDIQVHKPDVMIIDQFSLIRHKGGDREGMTVTSRRLKELAGKHGVVIVLLYQANGDYGKRKDKGESKADDGLKELNPPKITDYSETIAVIQDANVILTFDSTTWKDQLSGRQCGKALLYVAKGRNGGEGTELELNWIPNEGVIDTRKATDIF